MTQDNGDTQTARLLSIRVSAATHRLLRIRVAEEDTSIQQWVELLIERELAAPAAQIRPEQKEQ
jgi:predicted HicB family RNase H-like nuclease